LSRLTSNIKLTLKITFTSESLADITRSLAIVQIHLKFFKKILILIFFSDIFSVECKFFCPNSADNTMENRAISLVESSRDNESSRTSSGGCPEGIACLHTHLLTHAHHNDRRALWDIYCKFWHEILSSWPRREFT
jgi:hypothetical protein